MLVKGVPGHIRHAGSDLVTDMQAGTGAPSLYDGVEWHPSQL